MGRIVSVAGEITTTYDLERHVWEEDSETGMRVVRDKTLSEFLLKPSLSFLSDIIHSMHGDSPRPKAYWVQAEYGAGKSHLLAVTVQLALAGPKQWNTIREKEKQEGILPDVSLLRNVHVQDWREDTQGSDKGIFPIVCNLVGRVSGSSHGFGSNRLIDCIFNVASNEFRERTGSPLLLYPAEKLVQRFMNEDKLRYFDEFKEFLATLNPEERLDLSDLKDMSMGDMKNAALVISSFYRDWLKVEPRIATDKRSMLRNMVNAIMQEGYRGILIVVDEVGQFLQSSLDPQDDEDTLLVLSQFLPHTAGLPVWTVAATQDGTVSDDTLRKLIAESRFQPVELLKDNKLYSTILTGRIRTILNEQDALDIKRKLDRWVRWSKSMSNDDFLLFYPFHPECFEVVRRISARLVSTRSALSIMHGILQKAVDIQDKSMIISLDAVIDELLGSMSVFRAHFDAECRSWDSAFSTLQNTSSRLLRRNMDHAVKILKVLFIYSVAEYRERASLEDIVDAVMMPHEEDSLFEETCEFYEILLDAMQTEVVQINRDVNGYWFSFAIPESRPIERFKECRRLVDENEILDAWNMLLRLGEWRIETKDGIRDFSYGLSSPFSLPGKQDYLPVTVEWCGREVKGKATIKDFSAYEYSIPKIRTDRTDDEFLVILSPRSMTTEHVRKVLDGMDPRVILWVPGAMAQAEKDILTDFAAYRRMLDEAGQLSEETTWVYRRLKQDLPRTLHVLSSCYKRGRMQSSRIDDIPFTNAGKLETILAPAVGRVLDDSYVRNVTVLEQGSAFSNRDCLRVINGFVKHGRILTQDSSLEKATAERFAVSLGLAKREAPRELDISNNVYCQEMLRNISGKRVSSREVYSMFTGIPFGLTRRMVQMYLIALVRTGHIRIELSDKRLSRLDAENVTSIDFTARLLNSIAFAESDSFRGRIVLASDSAPVSAAAPAADSVPAATTAFTTGLTAASKIASMDPEVFMKRSVEFKEPEEIKAFITGLEERLYRALAEGHVVLKLELGVFEKQKSRQSGE